MSYVGLRFVEQPSYNQFLKKKRSSHKYITATFFDCERRATFEASLRAILSRFYVAVTEPARAPVSVPYASASGMNAFGCVHLYVVIVCSVFS
ncbi:hypothetical protein CEXT_749351 [Caerostris extrusa]|uniref:Uncharacterized protein n=1 Tax=Caerostris extrusa TaxID=172846 RepID=A0AAV4QU14_CAEEX|nr:hypothetical protein CEXT_749351 [Caerostris extrusa]